MVEMALPWLDIGQNRSPERGGNRAKSAETNQHWSRSPTIGRDCIKSGGDRPDIGRHRPTLADIAKIGRARGQILRRRTTFRQEIRAVYSHPEKLSAQETQNMCIWELRW